jgi:hypothetical protein
VTREAGRKVRLYFFFAITWPALGIAAVTRRAIPREDLFSRRDRLRRGGHRVLDLRGFGIPLCSDDDAPETCQGERSVDRAKKT